MIESESYDRPDVAIIIEFNVSATVALCSGYLCLPSVATHLSFIFLHDSSMALVADAYFAQIHGSPTTCLFLIAIVCLSDQQDDYCYKENRGGYRSDITDSFQALYHHLEPLLERKRCNLPLCRGLALRFGLHRDTKIRTAARAECCITGRLLSAGLAVWHT